MDLFHRDDLRDLATNDRGPCVTIMMPTARVESELNQNPIRLKNLLKRADEELKEQGYRDEEIGELLQSGRELMEGDDFWRKMEDGLAIFLCKDESRVYRLPINLKELVVVGKRFHVKPLFPLIASNNRFYLLALSRNTVQLFQGTHFSMNEVHVEDIPRSLADALFLDDPEKTLQAHTGKKLNKGREDLIYHGHGHPGEDYRARPQDALRRFFQQIDDGLKEVLRDDNAPMVLAGVSYYLPIYREINSYEHLVEHDLVSGNWEHLSNKEMHDRAWEIVEPLFMTAQQTSLEKFQQLFGNGGDLASADLKEIVPAAVYHRVDTLFVPIGEHQWGQFDPESNTVEIHEEHTSGDEDLLDLAAVHTYLNGGTVHALQPDHMPVQRGSLAATFRYAPGAPASERRNGS